MGAVTSYQFAIGNGVQTAFTLMDPSMVVASAPTVTALYRTDWQGKQLLYTTARTNNWLQSTALGTAPNVCAGGTGATITGASGIAPDGTNTAWKLAEDSATSAHYMYQSIVMAAGPASTTFYLKAAERTWAKLELDAGVQYGWVNLATGAVGTLAGGASIVTSPLGNGWWKCTITGTVTAASHPSAVGPTTGDNSSAAVGIVGNGILVWHPQNEAGSLGTSDIPTTASAASNTDYSVAGVVATLAPAPIVGATLAWTGTDSNGPFIPSHSGAGAAASFGNMGAR